MKPALYLIIAIVAFKLNYDIIGNYALFISVVMEILNLGYYARMVEAITGDNDEG